MTNINTSSTIHTQAQVQAQVQEDPSLISSYFQKFKNERCTEEFCRNKKMSGKPICSYHNRRFIMAPVREMNMKNRMKERNNKIKARQLADREIIIFKARKEQQEESLLQNIEKEAIRCEMELGLYEEEKENIL